MYSSVITDKDKLDQLLLQVSKIRQQQLEDRVILKNHEEQLLCLTKNTTFQKEFSKTKKDLLSYRVAKDVSSVVGLKEAITWKSYFLKSIWTIALCVGVAATAYFVFASWNEYTSDPTATRIEIVSKDDFSYPAIILCPTAWLDADKALSLGLSLEGLKYALGYVSTNADKVPPDNNTIGRLEFLSFFNQSNFTSFDDFLIAISPEIPLEPSFNKFNKAISTVAHCPRCQFTVLQKVVTHLGVCYNFELQAEAGGRQLSSIRRLVSMQVNDRSGALISKSLWNLYVGSDDKDLSLKRPIVPRMMIKPFTYVTVRIHRQKFRLLSKPKSPCVSKKKAPPEYSSTVCIGKCLMKLYSLAFGCTPLEITVGKVEEHPSELCNIFDNAELLEFDELTDSKSDFVLNSTEAQECYKGCPHSCDRSRYETTQLGEHNDVDYSNQSTEAIETALRLNITFVDIYVENAALYQGGIMTLVEFSTISFTSLVSNVGGTLGLFVGATMMTFVQIIMFVVKVFAEKTNSPPTF